MSITTQRDQATVSRQTRLLGAPSATAFPPFPAGWYYVCRLRDLRNRPVAIGIAARKLVMFRGSSGSPTALDSNCAHMGAELSRGCVLNGRIQCPFHGWEYDEQGRCVHIPAQTEIPAFALQRAHPTIERSGMVFVYLGGRKPFPFPELFEPTKSPLIVARPASYVINCPWYMFGANGFDVQHFRLVHGRELLDEPQVDIPAPFGRRIRFRSRVVGQSRHDRLIRRLIGDTVDVTITSWAGTIVAVTARFRRAVSRILFSVSPEARESARANVLVLAERSPWYGRWAQPLELLIRRKLTVAFLRGDTHEVRGAVYRPETVIEADRVIVDYYHWLAALAPPGDSDE